MGLRRRLRRLLRSPPSGRPAPVLAPPARPPRPPVPDRFSPQDPAVARLDAALLHPRAGQPGALRPVGPGLWEAPVLSAEGVARLSAEVAAVEAWNAAAGRPLEPPNSMNDAGFRLDDVGLGALSQALLEVARPLADAALPRPGGWALGDPHGFVVAYGPGADHDLGFHVDDSAVTLNLCLQRDGGGGEVWFDGVRCAVHRQDPPGERVAWTPRPGWALVHRGAHRHGAWPVRGGARRNLVVWCRDPAARAAERADAAAGRCPPWCGHDAPPATGFQMRP